ncbi:hypothetical protein VQH23_20940 [Pararoseomonas sp. SCSIO 73927]|uniref:hypothetical protein n=1 Tax=Pararoseomonas sp. SCSIO 73927 TaxID=3114537 RepID=UPI0030D5D9B7
MPSLSPHLPNNRLPQRGAARRRCAEPKRELDHDLRVESGGQGSVRLVINGTVEALTANEAARFGAMIIETARRAGAVG